MVNGASLAGRLRLSLPVGPATFLILGVPEIARLPVWTLPFSSPIVAQSLGSVGGLGTPRQRLVSDLLQPFDLGRVLHKHVLKYAIIAFAHAYLEMGASTRRPLRFIHRKWMLLRWTWGWRPWRRDN